MLINAYMIRLYFENEAIFKVNKLKAFKISQLDTSHYEVLQSKLSKQCCSHVAVNRAVDAVVLQHK